jgi:RimJ/RimL family protein N-acetyltransferase
MTIPDHTISLRLVDVSDAPFILALRLSPRGRYLSPVDDDLGKQQEWIRQYKAREARGEELYFIIHHATAGDIGTTRMCRITATSFEWGSWILKEDAPRESAMVSACLVHDLGLLRMKCDRAHFVVRKGNLKTIAFTRRFGASITGEDDGHLFMAITRDEYLAVRRRVGRQFALHPPAGVPLAAEEDADGGPAGGAEAL